jgi:hypothetical protein
MTQFAERPNPAAVPTLTEVIELLSPTPVGDVGMTSAPRAVPAAPGTPEGAPIVTSGLAGQSASSWTPMTTVVVPTLHEVAVPPVALPDLPVLKSVVSPPVQQAPLPELSEAQLTQRVMSVVQKRIDGMIEFRLKEAMAPILARHTDALVRELREELTRTMSDVVARSVAQEMAKLRQR